MRYNTVLFDIDNTLMDTDDQHIPALQYVYETFRKYFSTFDFSQFQEIYQQAKAKNKANLGKTGASFSRTHYFYYLLSEVKTPNIGPLALQMSNTYWDYVIQNSSLYPHVPQILEKLKLLKIKTAIISDNRTELQLRKLKHHKIDNIFDIIITAELAGITKPSQIPFLMAINQLETSTEHTLMVGNNPHTDILGAYIVGIDSCLFMPGYKKEESTINSTYTITDFQQLEDILLIRHLTPKMEQKVILLDLFGTVIKETDPVEKILLPILNKYKPISLNKFIQIYNQAVVTDNSIEIVWKKLNISLKTGNKIMKQFTAKLDINHSFLTVLSNLSKQNNIKLGIITNLHHDWLKHLMPEFSKIFKMFAYIFTPTVTHSRKEAPAYWEYLVTQLSEIPPQNILIVDNNPNVIRRSNTYRIPAVLFPYPTHGNRITNTTAGTPPTFVNYAASSYKTLENIIQAFIESTKG